MSQAENLIVQALRKNLRDPHWSMGSTLTRAEESEEIAALMQGFRMAQDSGMDLKQSGAMARRGTCLRHASGGGFGSRPDRGHEL